MDGGLRNKQWLQSNGTPALSKVLNLVLVFMPCLAQAKLTPEPRQVPGPQKPCIIWCFPTNQPTNHHWGRWSGPMATRPGQTVVSRPLPGLFFLMPPFENKHHKQLCFYTQHYFGLNVWDVCTCVVRWFRVWWYVINLSTVIKIVAQSAYCWQTVEEFLYSLSQ